MSGILQSGKPIGLCLAAICVAHCLPAQTVAGTGEADRSATAAATVSPEIGKYTPMTQKERLRYYFLHMLSPEAFLRSAAGAGINQAMNTPSEWGQGAEGYGKRYASSFGGHIVQSTVMYGTGAILHEDDRYFRSGRSGFVPRLKYAILSTFEARHDDGSVHFSYSRVSSYAAAAAISRAWQPPSTRGPVNFADSFAINVGAEAGFNVVREFLPSIFHSHSPVAMNQAPGR